MSLLPGARVGVYEVVDLVGRGGMGEVYRALDTSLSRYVAIKVLPGQVSADPDSVARFEREALTLATLNHPNIAVVHGLVEVPSEGPQALRGRALVMELVDGETLADRLSRGRLPLDEAFKIAGQIADALEAAHEKASFIAT
jgi:serine/threonine protein kinase